MTKIRPNKPFLNRKIYTLDSVNNLGIWRLERSGDPDTDSRNKIVAVKFCFVFLVMKNWPWFGWKRSRGIVKSAMCFCCRVAGKPGQWLFHTSNRICEGSQISYDFLCRQWYIQELQNNFWFSYWDPFMFNIWSPFFWDPFWWITPCPCWWWQATWDWRFWIDWTRRCATLVFPFSTITQV